MYDLKVNLHLKNVNYDIDILRFAHPQGERR